MKKSILHLTLHRQYFAAIAAGTKRTEYRRRTRYWAKRLEGRRYNVIKFRNGYAADAPEMLVQFRGVRRLGREYAMSLGKIISIKRWRTKKAH